MTLSSTTVKVSYSGDDATTAFACTFVFWDDSDVKVIHRDSSGTETDYVQGTNYTITGGSGSTGTVTTKAGFTLATGETLVLKSDRADTQTVTLPAGGAFPSSNVETALDQMTRMIQQRAEEVDRKVGFSETSSNSDVDLPDLVADELWQVNSAGTALESKSFATLSSSELTTPVSLALGGTATDLSSPTAKDILRIDSAGTGMEGRSLSETVADLFVKGADIASADPLVVGTDGHFFDVTGTTGFASMTVAAGRLFMVQFDGALVLTHHATNLDLPGEANITTAAGDVAICYATAASTVQVVSYTKADGTAVVASADTTVPTGGMIPYGSTTAPSGYLLCDGATVASATYGDLFAVIGTSFGGDATNFDLPDLRGRSPLGMDDMGSGEGAANRVTAAAADSVGGVSGAESISMGLANNGAHTHTGTTQSDAAGAGGGVTKIKAGTDATGSSGSGTAKNTMNPYQATPWIIKT